MIDHPLPTLRLMLKDRWSSGRLMVDLAPFIKFDMEMNQRLESLENEWCHLATPRAVLADRQSFVEPGR